MANLTWRNVDAPDFRTSLEGYKTFSDLLGNAFAGAKETIGGIDQNITNRVNTDYMLKVAAMQDSEAAKAALAADPTLGAQGSDRRRISGASLQASMLRPTNLLEQEVNEFGLKRDKFTQNRLEGNLAKEDAAAPAAAAIIEAVMSRDPIKIAAARKQYAPQIANLPLDKLLSTNTSMQNIESGTIIDDGNRLGNIGKKISNDTSTYNLAITKEDRADEKAGAAAALEMLGGSADRATALSAFTDGKYKNLSPRAKLAAKAVLDGTFGNIFAPTEGSAIPPTSNTDGVGSRAMGWTPRSSTGGDNSDAAVNTKLSLVSKVAGGTGVDQPLTREQFLKLDMTQGEGRAAAPHNYGNMRESDGKGGLRWKQFGSREEYNKAQQAWLGRRYDEGARTIRDAIEGRSVNKPNPRTAIDLITARAAQDDPTGMTSRLQAGQNDRSTPDQIVTRFSTGSLKDIPRQQIRGYLDRIVREGNVNYGEAAVYLDNALRDKNGGIVDSVLGYFDSSRSKNFGKEITEELLAATISEAKHGRNAVRIEDAKVNGDIINSIKAANSVATAAQTRLDQLIVRARNQPGLNTTAIPAAQADVARAEKLLEAALSKTRPPQTDDSTPQGTQTVFNIPDFLRIRK